MAQSKYVVGKAIGTMGAVCAVVFDDKITHADVGYALFGEVYGAGFCALRDMQDGIEVCHWGRSESLGKDSRPEDLEFIQRALGLQVT